MGVAEGETQVSRVELTTRQITYLPKHFVVTLLYFYTFSGPEVSTKKFIEFVSSQIHPYTLVNALPGIGPVYAERLDNRGFCYAWQVLLMYLWLRVQGIGFKQWLASICGVYENQCWQMNHLRMDHCYFGLHDWCKLHLPPTYHSTSESNSTMNFSFPRA